MSSTSKCLACPDCYTGSACWDQEVGVWRVLSPRACVFLCQRISCQKWRCSRRSGCSPSLGEVRSSWSWGGTRKPCWISSTVCRSHQVRGSFWWGTEGISTNLSWAAVLSSAERCYALDDAYSRTAVVLPAVLRTRDGSLGPGQLTALEKQTSTVGGVPQNPVPWDSLDISLLPARTQAWYSWLSPRDPLLLSTGAGISLCPRKWHVHAWRARGCVGRPVRGAGSGTGSWTGSCTCPEHSRGRGWSRSRGSPPPFSAPAVLTRAGVWAVPGSAKPVGPSADAGSLPSGVQTCLRGKPQPVSKQTHGRLCCGADAACLGRVN